MTAVGIVVKYKNNNVKNDKLNLNMFYCIFTDLLAFFKKKKKKKERKKMDKI